MIFGISGLACPSGFPFAGEINGVANANPGCPPLLLASIAWRESISTFGAGAATCLQIGADPQTGLMPDGSNAGRGLCQLTNSFPPDWEDPIVNLTYAWQEFLQPAIRYWHGLENYTGNALIKLVGATFNEGLSAAIKYHAQGNVDLGDTDDYGAGILVIFTSLRDTGKPS